MNRSPSNGYSSKVRRLRRLRSLRFDVLEERRLLAGLQVHLFEDIDASRSYDSQVDVASVNKAVYLDLNLDGRLSPSEPWTTTDNQGIASFQNLEPGEYTVRLLGKNNSVVQSFPTAPASSGTWSNSAPVSSVLAVSSTGDLLGIRDNQLVRIGANNSNVSNAIDFGTSSILDAELSFDPQDVAKGFVLVRNTNGSQSLWQINAASKSLVNVNVNSARGIAAVGNQLLMIPSDPSQELAVLSVEGAPTLSRIGLTGVSADAEIKSVDASRFAVMEPSLDRIAVYEFENNSSELIARRQFASEIRAWDVAGSLNQIAVSTQDDFHLLNIETGLPTSQLLVGAIGPVQFDPLRQLLFTGSAADASKLIAWSTSDGTPSFEVALGNEQILGEANPTIRLDRFGGHLVAMSGRWIHQHELAVAAVTTVLVANAAVSSVELGIRFRSNNRKPELNPPAPIELNEDESVLLDPTRLSSQSSDPDGDGIVYVVRSTPRLGAIEWGQDFSGEYKPSPDANGQDSILIQAYDGRDWSEPQALAFRIQSVNDAPTGFVLSTDAITENPAIGSALVTFNVVDPDGDVDFDFQVDDPRFAFFGNVLKFVSGVVNFEVEPLLVLAITGIDRGPSGDRITRNVSVSVRDANDPPTGILTPDELWVPELTEGFVLGNVKAIDEDADSRYSWSLSDGRFEIVDGLLRLARGVKLDFETQSTIAVTLRGVDHLGQFHVQKTVNVAVTDQDDPPIGLILSGSGTVPENRPGVRFGSVSVIDPDVGELYDITVNDPRVEVVKGVAKLRDGMRMEWVEPGYVDLMFTATSQRSGVQLQKSGRLHIVRDTTPYHNDANPLDVNGDGIVSPLDPLDIINYINRRGIGKIEHPGEGEGQIPDLDVDGDGEVTPLDILILINELNNPNDGESSGSGNGNSGGAGGGGTGSWPEGEGEGGGNLAALETNPFSVPSRNPVNSASSLSDTDSSFANYCTDLEEFTAKKAKRRS